MSCKNKSTTTYSTQFMVSPEEGFILYLYTKFETDSSCPFKCYKGYQNLEIGSGDLGHAHLGVILCSLHWKAPSSICIPNVKPDSLIRFKSYSPCSHTRTVVRECCKGDDASQWENGKFDPLPPPNPLTDRHQKLHT